MLVDRYTGNLCFLWDRRGMIVPVKRWLWIGVLVTVTTIFALKLFVQPYLMTHGGPLGTTQSLVQYMVRAAFTHRDLGLACAAGVLFLLAVGAVTVGQRLLARRWEAAS